MIADVRKRTLKGVASSSACQEPLGTRPSRGIDPSESASSCRRLDCRSCYQLARLSQDNFLDMGSESVYYQGI